MESGQEVLSEVILPLQYPPTSLLIAFATTYHFIIVSAQELADSLPT